MTRPPLKDSVPVRDLARCCPEAQADGVPCTELGRDCEVCERAIPIRYTDPWDEDKEDQEADPSAV